MLVVKDIQWGGTSVKCCGVLRELDSVTLKDTETGETTVVVNKQFGDEVFYAMRLLKPYGYIDGMEYLVQIGEASLQLLEYVDSVDDVTIHCPSPLASFVQHIGVSHMQAVDANNTLFVALKRPFTLLNVMIAYRGGWRDNKYYIYKYNNGYSNCLAYRVSFNNPKLARRLITKVVTLGGDV